MSAGQPRIAIGGLLHETHSFMSGRTRLADFAAQQLHFGEDMLEAMRGTRSGIGGMIDFARSEGWRGLPTLYATAMPAGLVTASAWQTLRDGLLSRLKMSLPLDGVLLALHGAMAAEGELDPEGEILAGAREIVGAETPIVGLLDMHGNVSPRLVELADVLLAYDSNPHLDSYERGVDCAESLARLLRREVVPCAAFARPPMLLPAQSTGTSDPPLALVHARAAQFKADPAVLGVAVMGGFAYADTPFTGPSVIVTTDGQPALARSYASELSEILYRQRERALPDLLGASEAVNRALRHAGGPVILVDSADNIGGGTTGDGPEALAAMLEHDVEDGAIVLADAEAVAICKAAGLGASVRLSVGGKHDNWHGAPVPVEGRVRAFSDGLFSCERADNHFASLYADRVEMGECAWLRAAGVNILLTERKTPPMDLAQLRHIGIIPEAQSMIVVKSAVAYRAAYLPIAGAVIEMDTPGLCSANLSRFPYRQIPRPVYPLD